MWYFRRSGTGKARTVSVLVATDILARGIDIEEVNLVINFDVPASPESYVHRIGRTARANSTGVALMLVSADELYLLRRIEKFLGLHLPLLQEEWSADYATELKEERPSRPSNSKRLGRPYFKHRKPKVAKPKRD